MLLGEVALSFVLAAAPPRKRTSDPDACGAVRVCAHEDCYTRVQRIEAIGMTQFIEKDFAAVPAVREVTVTRNGDLFAVDIAVEALEFEACRPIYEKQMAFYSEFPSYEFDFAVRAA